LACQNALKLIHSNPGFLNFRRGPPGGSKRKGKRRKGKGREKEKRLERGKGKAKEQRRKGRER